MRLLYLSTPAKFLGCVIRVDVTKMIDAIVIPFCSQHVLEQLCLHYVELFRYFIKFVTSELFILY